MKKRLTSRSNVGVHRSGCSASNAKKQKLRRPRNAKQSLTLDSTHPLRQRNDASRMTTRTVRVRVRKRYARLMSCWPCHTNAHIRRGLVFQETVWVNQGERFTVKKQSKANGLIWWQFATKENDVSTATNVTCCQLFPFSNPQCIFVLLRLQISFGVQFQPQQEFISLRKGRSSGSDQMDAAAEVQELVPQQRIKSQRATQV